MIIKHLADHVIVNTPTCGEVHEILKKEDYDSLGVAICINIKPTQAHYHLTFDETYFMLDGQITLELYEPSHKKTTRIELSANELCVITKGIHHRIINSSDKNRLCVISSPPFHVDDEHPSEMI